MQKQNTRTKSPRSISDSTPVKWHRHLTQVGRILSAFKGETPTPHPITKRRRHASIPMAGRHAWRPSVPRSTNRRSACPRPTAHKPRSWQSSRSRTALRPTPPSAFSRPPSPLPCIRLRRLRLFIITRHSDYPTQTREVRETHKTNRVQTDWLRETSRPSAPGGLTQLPCHPS